MTTRETCSVDSICQYAFPYIAIAFFFKSGSLVFSYFQCLVSVRKLADMIFVIFFSKFSFAQFFSNDAQNGFKRVSKFAQNGPRHAQIRVRVFGVPDVHKDIENTLQCPSQQLYVQS